MTETTHHRGRFLALVERDGWEYCSRVAGPRVVTVVAVTDAGELLLTEQYRIPLSAPVIELPAGLVGDEPGQEDESAHSAGARELEEETGYRARRLERMTEGPTSAGLSDEFIVFLRAHELTRVGSGGGTAGESITVHRIPVDEVPGFLETCRERGARVDPKIFAALWFLQREAQAPIR